MHKNDRILEDMKDEFLQDLRYAFRMLRRDPGFAVITVLVLAIGIGANTALFTVVNAVLLRQLPFREPDNLIRIWSSRPDMAKGPFSLPDFLDYREQNRSFERLSAFGNWNVNLTGQGDAERLAGLRVSADFFSLLGVDAAFGRTLLAEDDRPGAPRVVVMTYGLWQRRFGADRNVVGRNILLNGESFTVVGVLPPQFFFPVREVELACPLSPMTDPWRLNRESTSFLRLVGRLKPGVTEAQAQQDMSDVARRLMAQYPKSNARKGVVVVAPFADELVGGFRLALWTLQAAVGVVLLIACANLANLMLARGVSRGRESAIRAALGAGRARLLRQSLTENLLLSLLGGGLGLVFAHWAVPGLLALSPANLPRAQEATLDGSVLAFTLGLSVLSALLFGLFPALATARLNLNKQLNEGRSASEGVRSHRLGNALVVTEVALSLMLLTATGLLLRSFARLQAIEPGFESSNVLTLRMSLPRARYANPDATTRFYEQVLPKMEALPGVVSASASSVIPLNGQLATVDFTVAGRPPIEEKDVPAAQYRMVGPGFFHTMGIPFRQGSAFTDRDTATSTPVAIVNETLARKFFPNGNPIGERLEIDDVAGGTRAVEIIGVVGDVRHYGLDAAATYDIYIPWRQVQKSAVVWLANNQYWILRTAGDPMALAETARRQIQAVDPDVAASAIRSLDDYVSASVAPRRFNLQLLAIFAGAALLLASGGIYGVISYSVSRRTHEIGLRMTLGARPADILRLVVAQAMAPAAMGVVLGVAGSLAVSRLLTGLLFQVSATDPATYAAVACVLSGVAVLAAYLPARRATRIDPLAALRS